MPVGHLSLSLELLNWDVGAYHLVSLKVKIGLCLELSFACSWLKVSLSKYQISPLSAHVWAGTPVQYSFWDHSDLRDITFEIFHYRVAF